MTGFTRVEQLLIQAVESGTGLDLDAASGIQAIEAWGDERSVRASVIRDIMRGNLAKNPDPRGLILRGARIKGRLDLQHVVSTVPLAIAHCHLPDGADLSEAKLPTVVMDYCTLDSSLVMNGAQIDGYLFARNMTIRSTNMAGFHGDGLMVKFTLSMRNLNASGQDHSGGVIRMPKAQIGADLDLSDSTLTSDTSPCFVGDGIHVGGNLRFADFTGRTSGSSPDGTVRLTSAVVDGQLTLCRSKVVNQDGPALSADLISVGGSAFLDELEASCSSRTTAAVRLLGARVGSQIRAPQATILNDKGTALVADRLHVNKGLYLEQDFKARGAGQGAVVQLTGAHAGAIYIQVSGIEHSSDEKRLLDIDGLTYEGLPGIVDFHTWLNAISKSTIRYAAQPYRQLAANARAAGHDGDAIKVLITQRRDQIERNAITGNDRTMAKFLGLALGFGYQPWRALVGLFLVASLAVGLTLILGGKYNGLAKAGQTVGTTTSCTTLERVSVGLEAGLPLVKANAKGTCVATSRPSGNVITISAWILQVFSWAFATLFIAGFTGIVRKA